MLETGVIRELDAISRAFDALVLGAVRTAVKLSVGFDAMPDDAALAMIAAGCHCMNSALEAVEGHFARALNDLEGLVVIVSADVTSGHRVLLLLD